MPGEASSDAPTPWSADSAAESVPGTPPRDTLIALKGEAIYAATDYWIEGGQLFCVLRSGGEGAFDLNNVDWERSTRLNAERGITFNLRARATRPLANLRQLGRMEIRPAGFLGRHRSPR